jgi:hypothetical protein
MTSCPHFLQCHVILKSHKSVEKATMVLLNNLANELRLELGSTGRKWNAENPLSCSSERELGGKCCKEKQVSCLKEELLVNCRSCTTRGHESMGGTNGANPTRRSLVPVGRLAPETQEKECARKATQGRSGEKKCAWIGGE